jgi:hypothetical protein
VFGNGQSEYAGRDTNCCELRGVVEGVWLARVQNERIRASVESSGGVDRGSDVMKGSQSVWGNQEKPTGLQSADEVQHRLVLVERGEEAAGGLHQTGPGGVARGPNPISDLGRAQVVPGKPRGAVR